ncbi:MAG: trigger factor [Sphingobacteriaceae bacterium]|nr:trigger factor [Sphingobacteriaceae bacterium]
MNITQTKINDLGIKVNIVIAPADYTEKTSQKVKEQAKKATVAGFRKGMVPAAHIQRTHGKEILINVVNTILSEGLNNYITENKINILGQPLPLPTTADFKWDGNDTFSFDYELGLSPEITVDITSKNKFTQYVVKADEKTLAERMKNIRRSYGKMTNPEVSIEGDVLFGAFTQLDTKNNVFEGGINNTATLRLDLITDKAILKSLVGLKKDDEVVLDIQKALNGDIDLIAKTLKIEAEDAKDLKANFNFKVSNVNRLEEADLNQEFYDKIFGAGVVSDEAGFKAKITEEIESMFEQDAERKLSNDIYADLVENIKMDLPEDFLKRWLQATNEKLSEKDLNEGFNDFAKNLKWTLIENKIITTQKIELKYEDVFKTAKNRLSAQFAMYSPTPVSEEQLAQYTTQFLQEKENANRIFDEVKAIKTFEYIKTVATIEKKEIGYDKFTELVSK